MRITDLLDKRSINLNASPKSKNEALDMAVSLMAKSGKINDVESYRRKVYAREEESTTGVGEGIAIPHGKCDAVNAPGLAAMVIRDGVDFDSLDGEPVKILFLIAAPNTEDNVHLDVLSKLSVLLMDEEFVGKLMSAADPDEFLKIIDSADEEAKSIDDRLGKDGKIQAKILAVTSCPTGIAHTYMAAEGLEKAAAKAGCAIKIETRGSGGAKNVLTEEDIREAECIIVAADAQVPMDRFDGKKVIECQVSDGINKADRLISRALSGDVQVYKSSDKTAKASTDTKKSGGIGHKIYTQLMNGVSHMLPFVVGGGILIAIAFLIDGLSVDMNALSEAERGNFGTITPAAALFKSIGGAAFGFMLPVLAGFIAMAIGDRPALALGFVGGFIAANGKSGFLGALVAGFVAGYLIVLLRKLCDKLPEALEKIAPVLIYPVIGILVIGLGMTFIVEPVMGGINTGLNNFLAGMGSTSRVLLGFILAAMMAIDMGGPFNKAAYVFGTASIAAGNYDIMAAVMIGGMVPPCAIALATILFKNKFTKEERDAGPTNFIMGLAFITEGAIPYAAADPLRVIPACIIGSGAAGAISMFFKCTLMAPHGGIFVFPVVGHAVYYIVALVAGTIISTICLGLFKKKI
ncbi:MAG: fructose-specific PTS transporter subunit EIIC [Clostridia bacterium]|nr:fructose-specific PTS transporter subunit EIIC [Clostridia bacterium]